MNDRQSEYILLLHCHHWFLCIFSINPQIRIFICSVCLFSQAVEYSSTAMRKSCIRSFSIVPPVQNHIGNIGLDTTIFYDNREAVFQSRFVGTNRKHFYYGRHNSHRIGKIKLSVDLFLHYLPAARSKHLSYKPFFLRFGQRCTALIS